MLYSKAHNVVVYDTPTPERIAHVIPTSRVVDASRVAVPCNLQEMRTMRLMGFPALSPILHGYDWPGRHVPYDHQKQMSAFLTLHPKAFNLSGIGTGKTLGTLWAADYLMKQGAVRKALIISPLSTLSCVWQDEIFQNFLGHRSSIIVYGAREKRLQLMRSQADFYIINHDGLGIGSESNGGSFVLGRLAQDVSNRDDIDLVIVDEGSVYKDSGTSRYKVLKKTIANKPHIWWLTGTPTPNAPTDAWSQARLINKDFSESFNSFRERTMYRRSMFRWEKKGDAEKITANALQPAIVFRREDCLQLPPCQYVLRDVELTASQKAAHKAMVTKLSTMVGEGTINAVNEAVLRMKMLQISLGAVYDSEHEAHAVDCAPRLAVMREVVEQAGGKIIIFAPLTSVVDLLYSELHRDFSTEKVNGSTSSSRRSDIFRMFQDSEDPQIIVADPQTMAHGITLTRAATILWYGPTDKPEVYTQANGRINRPGQKNSMLVVQLAATQLEREIFKRLDNKQTMQGVVLSLVRTGE